MTFFLNLFQVTEEALVQPQEDLELQLAYASNSIQVLKEEEAYSFLSLVADVGGVLGLFIGFNFLMIWDWTVSALTVLPKVLKARKTPNAEK